MKTITCDVCKGSGIYYEAMPCIRCSGKGVLDQFRLMQLRKNYFPNRLTKGIITQQVFDKNIAVIDAQLEQLGVGKVVVSNEPVLLDLDMCDQHGITHATTFRELKVMFPLIYVKLF